MVAQTKSKQKELATRCIMSKKNLHDAFFGLRACVFFLRNKPTNLSFSLIKKVILEGVISEALISACLIHMGAGPRRACISRPATLTNTN